MTTKKRNTKKTPAPRTKKPTSRRRAAAPEIQQEDSAEAFGKALGRTLADLLHREVNSVAVSAWTAEPRTLGDVDAIVCREMEPMPQDRQFSGNVGDAISRLLDATSYSERLTAMERERLQPILGPEDSKPGADGAAPMGSRNSIASVIHEIANRIFADNSRRNAILDRLEI